MSTFTFSEEQQQELRGNKYTARVSANSLSFTKEFKELFFEKYQKGILPRDILRECGYSIDILGQKRIWGISYTIRKEYEVYGCFRDVNMPKPEPLECTETEKLTPEQQIRQLQQKLDYLTQEVEFLKKISSARTTRK